MPSRPMLPQPPRGLLAASISWTPSRAILVPALFLVVLNSVTQSSMAQSPGAQSSAAQIPGTQPVSSSDRTMAYVPMTRASLPERASQDDHLPANPLVTPDQAFSQNALQESVAWQNYMSLWKAHHADPSHEHLRRYFGGTHRKPQVHPGRSAPRWLGWKPRDHTRVVSPHFTLYSQADADVTMKVAETLEQCYWVWTQMFFPLWEAAPQVTRQFEKKQPSETIVEFLGRTSSHLTARRRMQVVLFRDAAQYVDALAKDHPGIRQSTGFYSDDRKTTFLIADPLNLPTLYHELVHQLFRQATRSKLGDQMPGEQRDFWLIEGIAGYFESLVVRQNATATVGGWDAPRLQFARFRVLAGGDVMPMNELRRDGRLAAQQRTDLPRWYAHAIAQTHRLLDSQNTESRRWVYQKLADLYAIETDRGIPTASPPQSPSVAEFLTVNDQHLIANPPTRPLLQVCLARCPVTSTGIGSLPRSPGLRWLDLSGTRVAWADIKRLLPHPVHLEQLSLEATAITNEISPWIAQADQLREMDLSWTSAGDPVVAAASNLKHLSTFWMTGSQVSDESLRVLLGMEGLSNLDVQRTRITESAVNQLRHDRPPLNLNPLELRPPTLRPAP